MSINEGPTASIDNSKEAVSVIKTYKISRRSKLSARYLEISKDEDTLYNVKAELSDGPTLTLKRPDQTGDEYTAAVKPDKRDNDMQLTSADATTWNCTPVIKHDGEGGSMDPYYTFSSAGRWYSWHNTCFNLASARQTVLGRRLTGLEIGASFGLMERAQRPHAMLASLRSILKGVQSWRHSQVPCVHWCEQQTQDNEAAMLAVLMGILDSKRRSSKEYRSGTALLY